MWSESDCLAYDPFAGDDYGSSMERDLGAKIVTGRGEYECHVCMGPIEKRERHRVDTCIMDGEYMTARFCGACCEAMAKSWADDGEAITARELNRFAKAS